MFLSPLAGDWPRLTRRNGADAALVAIKREIQLMVNPTKHTVFLPKDRIGLPGDTEQFAAAEHWLAAGRGEQETDQT